MTLKRWTALLLVWWPLFTTGAEEPIRIALLTDVSGAGAYAGKQTARGAALLEEDLRNEQRPLKIILEDHAMDTKRAVSAAQKVLFADRADAVFTEFSSTAIAINPLMKNSGKLYLYLSGAVSPLHENQNAFRVFIDFTAGCEALALTYKQAQLTRIGMLHVQKETGDLCFDGLRRVYPETSDVPYASGEPLATHVLTLKREKAEAIINVSYEGDIMNMLKELETLNFTVRVGTLAEAITAKVRTPYFAHLSRVDTFGPLALPETFKSRIKDRFPAAEESALDHAAVSYLHLRQLYQAILSCPGANTECQRSTLLKAAPDDLLGFTGWRDRSAQYQLRIVRASALP